MISLEASKERNLSRLWDSSVQNTIRKVAKMVKDIFSVLCAICVIRYVILFFKERMSIVDFPYTFTFILGPLIGIPGVILHLLGYL